MYPEKLIPELDKVLRENPDTEFYVLRNPDAPIPLLRHPNAVHRVSPYVPRGKLYLVDRSVFLWPPEETTP